MRKYAAILILAIICGCSTTKEESGNPTVLFLTDQGAIRVELYPALAPNTVNNFIELVRGGYYQSMSFHHIQRGLWVEGGCPYTRIDKLGLGKSGSGGPGYHIPFEHNSLKHDRSGRLVMKRRADGDESEGSQFYFTLTPMRHRDGRHTVFGQVISGMEVLYKISRTQAGNKASKRKIIFTAKMEKDFPEAVNVTKIPQKK